MVIVIVGDICCAQYPLHNFWNICNCDCLWILKVIVFMIYNTPCLCKYALKEICCASAFFLDSNESVIGIHAFYSLCERMTGFYPFPISCHSVMDYGFQFYSYTWNPSVSGISNIQWWKTCRLYYMHGGMMSKPYY